MIKTVATTIADAVRLAQADGLPDYWANRLEDGELRQAVTRNRIASRQYKESEGEAMTMWLRVCFGRRAA